MQSSNYGSMGSFLAIEKTLIEHFISTAEFIVEIGCYDGRYAYLAENQRYIGIDIDQSAISAAKEKYKNYNNIGFLCADATEIYFNERPKKTFIYSFNIFGNFSDPRKILEMHSHSEDIVMISMYGTDDKITKERIDYYRQCFPDEEIHEKSGDVYRALFTPNFTSIAYKAEFLTQMAMNCAPNSDIKVANYEDFSYGYLMIINNRPTEL